MRFGSNPFAARRAFLASACAAMLASAFSFVPSAQAQAAEASIEGTWAGVLDPGMGALPFRVFFTITRGANGALAGVADSPDQTTTSIPIDSVTLEGTTLRVEIKQIDAVYEGTWSEAPASIKGHLTQTGVTFPLDLTPATLVKPVRPQEPQPPFPYVQEEVRYQDAARGVSFAGTLTKPRSSFGTRRFPAVLLISGSGQQNRDEELYSHKPFLLLADTLTRRGIAVLRVDDRGVGGTTGDVQNATTEDFIGDALAGVEYLKSRRDIRPSHIGLIGHSEGGEIAPAVATRTDIAFIALLAAPGVRGDELLARQVEHLLTVQGLPEEFTTFWLSLYRALIEIALNETDAQLAQQRMAALWEQKKTEAAASSLSDQVKALIAASDSDARDTIQQLLVPWMRYFLAYDPQPILRQVQCPVLAMNGDLDLQVDAKQNLPAIEAALSAAGNNDVSIAELPSLNHLFQTAKTGAVSEYGQLEETFAPSALQLLSDWIVDHAHPRAR
jgi:pimeloyl-ACP methyl ester carboxylesterase